MQIHIERAGEKFGPYSPAEVQKHLSRGDLLPTDLGWRSGAADWELLSVMYPDVAVSPPTGRKPPRPQRRYEKVVVAVLVIVITTYMASPYYALWSLNGALESGDRGKLEAGIDFAAVRSGLKDDLTEYLKKAPTKDKDEDPLSALFKAIAGPLAEGMIEAMVTPEGLSKLIKESKVAKPGGSAAGSVEEKAARKDISEIRYAFFTGPTHFLVDLEGVKLRMSLDRSGWKLRRVEVPAELFESALK